MASPFYFLLVVIPILLVSAYFTYRGLQGHPWSHIIAGVGFVLVALYLYAYGIPGDAVVTTTIVSGTVTTNVVTYNTLKASNDIFVNGLAILFSAAALINLAVASGVILRPALDFVLGRSG